MSFARSTPTPMRMSFAKSLWMRSGTGAVAATLGADGLQSFFFVAIPMAKPGFLTAAILGFAHTVGEFGVVLMIGGNIPGQTRVVSVQIYDHVEALAYDQAHQLALLLVVFSFTVLLLVYGLQRKFSRSLFSFN